MRRSFQSEGRAPDASRVDGEALEHRAGRGNDSRVSVAGYAVLGSDAGRVDSKAVMSGS